MILKNCEPEISYILALQYMSEGAFFPNCCKVSPVVPAFKNVGERFTTENYCPVSIVSVVSKVFQNLVNNRFVGHLEKCGLFDF